VADDYRLQYSAAGIADIEAMTMSMRTLWQEEVSMMLHVSGADQESEEEGGEAGVNDIAEAEGKTHYKPHTRRFLFIKLLLQKLLTVHLRDLARKHPTLLLKSSVFFPNALVMPYSLSDPSHPNSELCQISAAHRPRNQATSLMQSLNRSRRSSRPRLENYYRKSMLKHGRARYLKMFVKSV
jgi:hypothetical protein